MERAQRLYKQHRKHKTLQWCLGTVLGAVLVLFLFTFWFSPISMANQSMSDTLQAGDILLYNRLSKFQRPPARGQMIVFLHPITGEYLIKRVIALGEETVRIENGRVIINDKFLLNESDYCQVAEGNFSEREVPKGAVFVLSDNRSYEDDSRNSRIGCVALEDVIGVVQIRVNNPAIFSANQIKTEATQP
ncbi:MAG: signal peptidase I [Clostridiales bacterium]|nr:signal peptidase I [Clostridiales bacterium]